MTVQAYTDEVLALWSERRFRNTCTITGRSMEPLIRCGDTLAVRYGPEDVRIGDVALFKKGDSLVAHRIVARRAAPSGEDVLIAKGDAARVLDDPIPKRDILARVEEVRGARGVLRLESRYWRVASRLLAIHSYASTEDARRSSILWRIAGLPHRLRERIPIRLSLRGAFVTLLRGGGRLLARSPRIRENPMGGSP